MKCSVVLTLLATFLSTGQATSSNDAPESLTSEAKTARGIPNPCRFACEIQGGSDFEVQVCIKRRCGGVNVEDGFEGIASEFLTSEAETERGTWVPCHLRPPSRRCGGVNVEDGFEENAEAPNSEAETTQEPSNHDHICEFVCRHYLITEEDIQECIRVDCGRFNATNDGEKNSSPQVLISEAETAPGSGNPCQFHCFLNGGSNEEVQDCIKARCRGIKTENGMKYYDASEVLISEPENEPAGNNSKFQCYYDCFFQERSDEDVSECIKSKCEGVKAKNSDTGNTDASEALIAETFLDPCTYSCIVNGQTQREIENCINWQCTWGKSEKGAEANAIASEVRISENANTAQASAECIWDCLRALKVHAVTEDDFEQCSIECELRETNNESGKEFNLRGSIKSD